MRFFEKVQMIERVDSLIKRKATGSARDLARRLEVSKSTVYEILEIMKIMGAEIEYCNTTQCFYYCSNKILAIGFIDKNKIKGGRNYFINTQEL